MSDTNKVTVELPEPDSYMLDDDDGVPIIPQWWNVALIGRKGYVEVWADGIETVHGFTDAEDITPDEVERAGCVLLAVAARMRKTEIAAWKVQPE